TFELSSVHTPEITELRHQNWALHAGFNVRSDTGHVDVGRRDALAAGHCEDDDGDDDDSGDHCRDEVSERLARLIGFAELCLAGGCLLRRLRATELSDDGSVLAHESSSAD